jgi:hypothetical protein
MIGIAVALGGIYFAGLTGDRIFDIPNATQAANLVSGFSEIKCESRSMETDSDARPVRL